MLGTKCYRLSAEAARVGKLVYRLGWPTRVGIIIKIAHKKEAYYNRQANIKWITSKKKSDVTSEAYHGLGDMDALMAGREKEMQKLYDAYAKAKAEVAKGETNDAQGSK